MEEKAILQRWISSGARWGTDPIDLFRLTTSFRAGYDWWSLRPVVEPALPDVKLKEFVRILSDVEAVDLIRRTIQERDDFNRRVEREIGLPLPQWTGQD